MAEQPVAAEQWSPFPVERCSTCNAPIIWAVTERARDMPVDVEPVADGNISLQDRGQGMAPLARVLSVAKRFGRTGLRQSHFASCKDAAQHRRRPSTAHPTSGR